MLTSSSDSGSDDNSDAPDRKVQKKKRNSAGSKKKVAQVVSDLSTDEEDAFTLSSGGSDAAASSTDDEEAVVQESDVPTTEDSDDAQDEFYGDEVKVLSMPSGAAAKQPLQKSLVSREAFESIVFVTDDQPPAVASAKVGSPSRRTMVQIRKTSTKGKGKVVDDPETTLPVASSSDEEEIEQKKVCLEHSHEAQVVIQSISSALEALTLGGTTTPSAASCPENAPEKPKRGRKPKVKAESDTVANKPVKKPASKKDAAPADTAHDNGSPSPSVFIIRKKGTHFHCPVPGCDKSFLNNNGLQYHLINFIHDPTGLLLWSFSAQQESEPADKEGAVSALLDTVPANLFPLLVPGFRYSFGSKKSQDHAMKWAPVKLSLAKAPGRAGKGGGGSKKADSLTFSGLPDKRIVVKRDKKWEESLGDLRSLLRSEYTVLPKDRGMAYVPRTSPLSVAVADKDSPVMISLFETLVVGKNRSWILNAGASVWGLDYAPLPSSSSSQFLAIGGYRSTVDEHHMVGDKMEPAFEHDPTMYGSIQIWRTDDEKSGPKIALCLVHEYGCVYDLKWCPFVTASTSNDMVLILPRNCMMWVLLIALVDGR